MINALSVDQLNNEQLCNIYKELDALFTNCETT